MLFKTIIEIETEASNKDEAAEIAGEYISGNFTSGVRMVCRTKRMMRLDQKIAAGGAGITVLLIAVALLSAIHTKPPQPSPVQTTGYAVQLPLKTALHSDKKEDDFKKKWMGAEARHSLDRIRR